MEERRHTGRHACASASSCYSDIDPSLTAVGDRLFFARSEEDPTESGLWTSDGTEAGTRRVAALPLRNRDAGSDTHLIAVGNLLFFINQDPAAGAELWRSDGTAAGTFQLADINPGPASAFYHSDPSDTFVPTWASLGTTLLFFATDGSSGFELWQSDGTAAGTRIVTEIAPGPGGVAGPPADYSECVRIHRADGRGGRPRHLHRAAGRTPPLACGPATGLPPARGSWLRWDHDSVSNLVGGGTAAFFTTSDRRRAVVERRHRGRYRAPSRVPIRSLADRAPCSVAS